MAELFDTQSNKAQTDGASLVGSADQQSSKQISASSREALAQQFLLTQSSLKPAAADNTSLVSRPEDSNNSLVGDFLYSAAYAGLQTPASGVGQLIDKVAGTNIEQNVHFMAAPTEAKFGSANWHAQQFGGGVGMIAPFLVAAAGTRWGLGKVGLAAEGSGLLGASQIANNAKSLAVLEGAASGFVFDFATRPVQDGEGNFWAARLKHGVTGAATFGTLTASTIGLRSLGGSAAAEMAGARKVLTNIGIGTASGLPAGFVAAESQSLLTHGKFASAEEVGKSMYTMGFVGGALTGLHQLPGQRKSFADTVVEQAAARDRATNLQSILATRSLKAETAATTSDANGLMLTGRDAGAKQGKSSLIERLLPKGKEGPARFALGDLVIGNRKFASDVEGKADFTIEVPRPELKPVLEQRVTQAYKVAGLDGKATTQEIADFFKWAETAEGIELRTAMGQVSDVVASQKLNTILLEAYLPREGVEHRVVGNEAELAEPHRIKLRIQHMPTEAQKTKWTEFYDMNLSPPKDAEGYVQFREGVFKWLNETAADPNLKTLQEWAREYNDQGSNSLSSGPLDYYFGTTNLNRFVEVYNGQRPAVEVREIEPRLIVDEVAEARIAAEEAAAKNNPVKASFDVQARINSFETSTGKVKVTDAILLADHTHVMSEAQFSKWIEYVTNPPAGPEGTMLRSMLTKGDVLKRPEVLKAISNERGATTPEAGDITLAQVREFLAHPKNGEVKPMPEWMKDYIEMRLQIASMTAKPDALPHQILDAALPRWLSENIKSKYTKPVEVKGETPQYSEMLPQEFVQWFEAARQSRPPGKPERQFTPDKNDFAYRADKLDQALKVEDPAIRENLLRLAPQDHSVLRSVLQKLDPEKAAAEYKELMQIILPKTENIQDVKLLFDVMFFGNRANQNSRPRKPMPGKPETPPEQIERAIEETKAHQQLASLLLESMVPSTDAKFARASEIVDGVITGKYRDPRPAFDSGPGGKPGGKPGGNFGDRDGGRFGPRDVDNGSRARRTLEGGGEKKNEGTEGRVRPGRVRLEEGTTDQTIRNERGSGEQNVGGKERVDDGAVVGSGGAEKGVLDKGVVEPVIKTGAEPVGGTGKVIEQVEQRRGAGEETVVTETERVVTEPQQKRAVKDEQVVEEAVTTDRDTNNGGNGQVVVEPPVEFREPRRKGGRREQFEEDGDYGYGERDRRDHDRKKSHRGREHRRNRGGGKDWRNLSEWDE